MKKLLFFIIPLTLALTSFGQVNLKDLKAYEDVQVEIKNNFDPYTAIVMEDKEYDKLLVGNILGTSLEMNDFKLVSKQAGQALNKAYLLRFNYEYIVDKKKCGGNIIKSINGKIVDMKRDDTLVTFKFEQKGNKICTSDITKALAYKLKSGS